MSSAVGRRPRSPVSLSSMITFRSFRFWLPALLGTILGVILLGITGLVHDEGWMLELVRVLHYLPNEFLTALFSIVPIFEQYLMVERVLFVLQWTLLGLCVGWMTRKISHERATA